MKFTLLLLLAVTLFCQSVEAQIKRSINTVETLSVTDRLWVSVIPSDRNEVIIEGELSEQVELLLAGSELKLKMKAGHYLKGNLARVVIYTPSLSKIIARKGAELNLEEKSFEGESIQIVASEGAKVRALLTMKSVDVQVNTGGTVDLLGNTESLRVVSTAGSSLFAKDLNTQDVFVRVNAGGKAEVFASESIDAETRVGGAIDVYGNPKERKQRQVAGGKINFYGNKSL
ncbi:GIN domain-containing protein [Sphingobacterium sp. HJSM2_6]|uniref:GIN domain-containing protein n=1 Tax=Sphingobacterium sp. HJSM2_6 TaxID=3366264 RepID=UPI003BECA413